MNIAAITITYNDGYKFKEWVEHYQEYKSELYLHIIVDNGSEDEYMAQLKSTFTDSIIIERGKNGGCMLIMMELDMLLMISMLMQLC